MNPDGLALIGIFIFIIIQISWMAWFGSQFEPQGRFYYSHIPFPIFIIIGFIPTLTLIALVTIWG